MGDTSPMAKKDRTAELPQEPSLLSQMPNEAFAQVSNFLHAVVGSENGEFTNATRKRAIEAMRRITIVKSDLDSAAFLAVKKAMTPQVKAAE